jgi:hypothetical protein
MAAVIVPDILHSIRGGLEKGTERNAVNTTAVISVNVEGRGVESQLG